MAVYYYVHKQKSNTYSQEESEDESMGENDYDAECPQKEVVECMADEMEYCSAEEPNGKILFIKKNLLIFYD